MKLKLFKLNIFIILFFNSCFETFENATRRIEINKSFIGIIDSMFLNIEMKNQQCILIEGEEVLIYNEIFNKFSIGDTLLKRAGSMKYYWIKNGDTTIFYQKCGPLKSDEIRDNK